MSLLDLPPETLIEVLSKISSIELHNMYCTCTRIRNIINANADYLLKMRGLQINVELPTKLILFNMPKYSSTTEMETWLAYNLDPRMAATVFENLPGYDVEYVGYSKVIITNNHDVQISLSLDN